jgi:hypothetical protein
MEQLPSLVSFPKKDFEYFLKAFLQMVKIQKAYYYGFREIWGCRKPRPKTKEALMKLTVIMALVASFALVSNANAKDQCDQFGVRVVEITKRGQDSENPRWQRTDDDVLQIEMGVYSIEDEEILVSPNRLHRLEILLFANGKYRRNNYLGKNGRSGYIEFTKNKNGHFKVGSNEEKVTVKNSAYADGRRKLEITPTARNDERTVTVELTGNNLDGNVSCNASLTLVTDKKFRNKPAPPVVLPEEPVANAPVYILYEHKNFGGASLELGVNEAVARFKSVGFNDKMSSFKYLPENDPSENGCKLHLTKHDFSDWDNARNDDDQFVYAPPISGAWRGAGFILYTDHRAEIAETVYYDAWMGEYFVEYDRVDIETVFYWNNFEVLRYAPRGVYNIKRFAPRLNDEVSAARVVCD